MSAEDLETVLADLVAEQAALEALLVTLDAADWSLATPAAGWQVRHQVAHLAFFDELGTSSVNGDSRPLSAIVAARAGRTEDETSLALLQTRLGWEPHQLFADWRSRSAELIEAFRHAPADRRVLWGAGPMALRSFATARLMETWAHGLDCFAAVGARPIDTARLRHICHLGYRALPYAFTRVGREMPAALEDLRLDLTAPDGRDWTFGPESARQVISGPAGDWARVAVQRATAPTTQLRANGELATQALELARAFA